MTPEAKVTKEIVKYLKDNKIYSGRTQANTISNGSSDYWFLLNGVYGRLEIKKVGGKPTLLQLKKLYEINRNGGIGVVVDDASKVEYLVELIKKRYSIMRIRKEYFSKYKDYKEEVLDGTI